MGWLPPSQTASQCAKKVVLKAEVFSNFDTLLTLWQTFEDLRVAAYKARPEISWRTTTSRVPRAA